MSNDVRRCHVGRSAAAGRRRRGAEPAHGLQRRGLISDGDTILHHCNTGALATVDWGTALGVVFACPRTGQKDSRAGGRDASALQGSRLTAWELHQRGIPIDLIADNAAGHFMRTGQVNIVLVGADRVAANGDVANKIGTYKLAVVAKENGVPFYPSCRPARSISTWNMAISFPSRSAATKRCCPFLANRRDPAGITARNPAFDVTPHRYVGVTGIVTEAG
jgi:methylthioribose-1-phosphate isomerase